jgi:hypothetical protein
MAQTILLQKANHCYPLSWSLILIYQDSHHAQLIFTFASEATLMPVVALADPSRSQLIAILLILISLFLADSFFKLQ